MALKDNSIGTFQFIALIGEPIAPTQRVMLDDRPGVTGTEVTLLARKGRPFQLISQVDAVDYDDANDLYLSYRETIEQDALELTKGGISTLASDNYNVKVIDVVPLRILPIRGAVGNKIASTGNQGFCECQWTLIAVPLA